jgi:hypothetical protein
LEGKLLRISHAWHNARSAGIVRGAWRLDAIKMKRSGDPHHPGVVNICSMTAIMHTRVSRNGSLKAVAKEQIEAMSESESVIGNKHFPVKIMNLIIHVTEV